MKMANRFLIAVFSFIFLSGCGYVTGSLLPDHLKTVYVDDFKNEIDITKEPTDRHASRIYKAGIESDITRAVIDRFIFDGYLRITKRDDADLILTGEVVDYYKQPLRYDKFDNVEEYRIMVVVNLQVLDTVKNATRLKKDGFIGYDTYRLTGALAATEDEACQGAIDDLAQKIVEKIVEAW